MQVKATLQHKILFKVPLVENFRRMWNLDRITVTKILKFFQTNCCRKRGKTFKIQKFVVLAEYFEQQTDRNRYRRKISKSRIIPSWRGISHIYISSTVGHVILRTALKRYFRFPWNCEQLRVEARNSMLNCETYFPIFSEAIHTNLKKSPQHNLRKCR